MAAALLASALASGAGCSSPEASRPSATAPQASTLPVPSAASATSASASPTADLACDGPPLSPGRLLCDVKHLAGPTFRGRRSASDDEGRAAAFLASELEKIGLAPKTLPFKARGFDSRNVFALIEAPRAKAGPLVILGAHVDHDGEKGGKVHWGADDNASGCAVVLGIARELVSRRDELGKSVAIVFFGAEEIGLYGSTEIAQRFPFATKPFVMINVDMVGRPLSDQAFLWPLSRALGIDPENAVGADVPSGRAILEGVVRQSADAEKHRAVLIDDLPEIIQPQVRQLTRGRGDNWPFEQAGIPTVFFSSAESSDYHQPTDTWETLSPELLATRARVILRTVIAVSNLPKL